MSKSQEQNWKHTPAFSRRVSRPSCCKHRPRKARGRREGRVLAAPMVRLQTKSRRRHHRYEPNNRPSLRDSLNGVLRALPGDRAFLPPSPRGSSSTKLSASVGAPGPHDFSVRDLDDRLSLRPRPSHPTANVRDDRERPSCRGRGMAGKVLVICPTRQARLRAACWRDGQITHGLHARIARRARAVALDDQGRSRVRRVGRVRRRRAGRLAHEPMNRPRGPLAKVRHASIATKFRTHGNAAMCQRT
jgi:hypothetical protein